MRMGYAPEIAAEIAADTDAADTDAAQFGHRPGSIIEARTRTRDE